MPIDPAAIIAYLTSTFSDITSVTANNDSYIFTDPEQKHPFATLVTSDAHDCFSDLNRAGVFRLNIGVTKQTFGHLFPDASTAHDFTALDTLMPHPVYGNMYWICILSPSEKSFETIGPLLAEAHDLSLKRYNRAEDQ